MNHDSCNLVIVYLFDGSARFHAEGLLRVSKDEVDFPSNSFGCLGVVA